MIYLASPYSSSEPGLAAHRFHMTEYYVAKYMQQNFAIFSPIVHCHALAENYNLPTDAQYWWGYNKAFLEKADELWVLRLLGWEESKGVRVETAWWNANRQLKPLRFKDPE